MTKQSNSNNPTSKIHYPCTWEYTLFGSNVEDMKTAVQDIIKEQVYHISESRRSKKGNYLSLRVTLMVMSEEQNRQYYNLLGEHPAIRIVL